MYTYDFETPQRPRVLGGQGVIERLPVFLDDMEISRIVLVTSPTFYKAAVARDVQELLGPRVVGVFSDVERHSPLPVILRATEMARELRCNGLISLGGGSAIDTAKGIAWYLDEDAREAPVKHVALPSTLSGAEFTNTSGITIDGVKRLHVHNRIIPVAAFLDPSLATIMPRNLMQGSLLNAMDHCLEGIMSIRRSPMTDATCLHAIRLMSQASEKLNEPSAMVDAQAGAALAVMDTSMLSVGLAHALAHVIGGRCRTPHGFTHGLVAAAVMRYNYPAVAPQLRMIAEALGVDTKGMDQAQAAWRAICAVQDLVQRMGAPAGLQNLGVPEADLPILAELVMEDPYAETNPQPVSPREALEVLKWAWTGVIPPIEESSAQLIA